MSQPPGVISSQTSLSASDVADAADEPSSSHASSIFNFTSAHSLLAQIRKLHVLDGESRHSGVHHKQKMQEEGETTIEPSLLCFSSSKIFALHRITTRLRIRMLLTLVIAALGIALSLQAGLHQNNRDFFVPHAPSNLTVQLQPLHSHHHHHHYRSLSPSSPLSYQDRLLSASLDASSFLAPSRLPQASPALMAGQVAVEYQVVLAPSHSSSSTSDGLDKRWFLRLERVVRGEERSTTTTGNKNIRVERLFQIVYYESETKTSRTPTRRSPARESRRYLCGNTPQEGRDGVEDGVEFHSHLISWHVLYASATSWSTSASSTTAPLNDVGWSLFVACEQQHTPRRDRQMPDETEHSQIANVSWFVLAGEFQLPHSASDTVVVQPPKVAPNAQFLWTSQVGARVPDGRDRARDAMGDDDHHQSNNPVWSLRVVPLEPTGSTILWLSPRTRHPSHSKWRSRGSGWTFMADFTGVGLLVARPYRDEWWSVEALQQLPQLHGATHSLHDDPSSMMGEELSPILKQILWQIREESNSQRAARLRATRSLSTSTTVCVPDKEWVTRDEWPRKVVFAAIFQSYNHDDDSEHEEDDDHGLDRHRNGRTLVTIWSAHFDQIIFSPLLGLLPLSQRVRTVHFWLPPAASVPSKQSSSGSQMDATAKQKPLFLRLAVQSNDWPRYPTNADREGGARSFWSSRTFPIDRPTPLESRPNAAAQLIVCRFLFTTTAVESNLGDLKQEISPSHPLEATNVVAEMDALAHLTFTLESGEETSSPSARFGTLQLFASPQTLSSSFLQENRFERTDRGVVYRLLPISGPRVDGSPLPRGAQVVVPCLVWHIPPFVVGHAPISSPYFPPPSILAAAHFLVLCPPTRQDMERNREGHEPLPTANLSAGGVPSRTEKELSLRTPHDDEDEDSLSWSVAIVDGSALLSPTSGVTIPLTVVRTRSESRGIISISVHFIGILGVWFLFFHFV